MAARYLRFVRALALASGAAHAGCDDGAILPPSADTSTDFADATSDAVEESADTTIEVDARADGDAETRVDTGPPVDGVCRTVTPDGGPDLPCEVGSACSFPDDADAPRCTFGIDAAGAGSNLECGGITCGEYCFCAGPEKSLCGCIHGAIGPLPPPDLPR